MFCTASILIQSILITVPYPSVLLLLNMAISFILNSLFGGATWDKKTNKKTHNHKTTTTESLHHGEPLSQLFCFNDTKSNRRRLILQLFFVHILSDYKGSFLYREIKWTGLKFLTQLGKSFKRQQDYWKRKTLLFILACHSYFVKLLLTQSNENKFGSTNLNQDSNSFLLSSECFRYQY